MKKSVLLLAVIASCVACQPTGSGYPSTLFASFVSRDTSTVKVGGNTKIIFMIKFKLVAWDRPAYFETPTLLWLSEFFDITTVNVDAPFSVDASLLPVTDIQKNGSTYKLGIDDEVTMQLKVTITTNDPGTYAVHLKKMFYSANGNDGDYEAKILFSDVFATLPVNAQ